MNKKELVKIIAKFDKVASPYPPGDYPYTQTEIKGNEVYHAVTRPETVIDIITNGVLRPIAGTPGTSTGVEIASGRVGFVSLTSNMNQAMSTFGDFMFVFDWTCLQNKNMGLLPIRYISMAKVPKLLGWDYDFDINIGNYPLIASKNV